MSPRKPIFKEFLQKTFIKIIKTTDILRNPQQFTKKDIRVQKRFLIYSVINRSQHLIRLETHFHFSPVLLPLLEMLMSIVFHSVRRRSGLKWTVATRILFSRVSVHVCRIRGSQFKVLVADRTGILASHVMFTDVCIHSSSLLKFFAAMLAGSIELRSVLEIFVLVHVRYEFMTQGTLNFCSSLVLFLKVNLKLTQQSKRLSALVADMRSIRGMYFILVRFQVV